MIWKAGLVLLAIETAKAACLALCSCEEQTMDCSSRQLEFVPDDLPFPVPPDSWMGAPRLPFGNRITELTLSNNRLHELPIQLSESLPHLQQLDMSGNEISDIRNLQNVLLFKKLIRLKLSSNPVRNLGLDKDTVLYSQSISHLDVSDCAINSITNPATFMFMMNLTYVNLSGNPLVIVDHLTSTTIVKLDLSRCLFGSNDKGIRDDSFTNLPSLRSLNLSNNAHLTRIPYARILSVSLHELDASFCALEKLDLRSFPNIRNASLNGNIVKVLNDNMLSDNNLLKVLELSENSIHYVEPRAFQGGASLEYLDLSSNFIHSMDWAAFSGIPNLRTLNVSRNLLDSLDAIPLPKLTTLDASKCDIQRLGYNFLTQMQQLEDLDLSHNSIEVLPKFKSNKLRSLDLSFCRLTDLHEESFQDISSLTRLDLEGNRLTTPIQRNVLQRILKIKEINLSDNPWTCICNDSDFEYLWKFVSDPPKTKRLRTLFCHSPKEMTGKPWNACFQGLKTEDRGKHSMSSFLVPFLTLCCLLAIIMAIRQVYSAHDIETQRRETQTSQESDSHSRVFLRRIAPHVFDEDMERGIQLSANETSQRSPVRELSKLPSYEEALLLPKPEDREDLRKITTSYEESGRFENSSSELERSAQSRPDARPQPSTSDV